MYSVIHAYIGNSIKGAEYFLGYVPHFYLPPSIIITTTESKPVYYRIEAPGIDYCFNGTIIPNAQNVVILPTNLIGKSHTFPSEDLDKIPKGIYIKTSSDDLTIIGQVLESKQSTPFLHYQSRICVFKNMCIIHFLWQLT